MRAPSHPVLIGLTLLGLLAGCSQSNSTDNPRSVGGTRATTIGSDVGGSAVTTGSVAPGGSSNGGISSGATATGSSGSTLGTMTAASSGGSSNPASSLGGANPASTAGGQFSLGGTRPGTTIPVTAGGTGTSTQNSKAGLGGGIAAGGTHGGASNVGGVSAIAATGGTATAGASGMSTAPAFASADEEILYKAVRFYGAERCGDAHNWTLFDNPEGKSCHLHDGDSVSLDLSGGWHDAGDHVKVTLTIAYAAYVMLKAYEIYPTAFKDFDSPDYSGKPNGIPDVLDEARFGLDWLVKAHPDPNTLVAMVSNSDYDHSTFMTSPKASTNSVETGGEPRPVQKDSGADFAGSAAAALALASTTFAQFDATLAANYLAKAKTAYAYAKAHPKLSTSMLYAWTGSKYTDDLMCGATELWRATSDSSYRSDAVSQNTSIGPHKYLLNYSQVSDLCRHSLVRAGEQSALAPWTTDVDRYTTLVSNDANLKGLIYLEKWGTCRHAMSAAFSAAMLYDVTKNSKYRDFARSQYAWIKGQNPQGRSFIIGWGTNPPSRPHHRNAYGYEDDAGWDADTPQLSDARPYHVLLVGGLVGGPNLDGYQDSVNDYVHNEVAIDYNAGLVGTSAFAVANP